MATDSIINLFAATTHKHVPVYVYRCDIYLEGGDVIPALHQSPVLGNWGVPITLLDFTKSFSQPRQICVEYYSFVENKNYQCIFNHVGDKIGNIISLFKNKDEQQFLLLICGFSVNGNICFWLSSNNKSYVLGLCTSSVDERTKEYDHFLSIKDVHDNFVKFDPVICDIEEGKCDPSKYFDSDMKQFSYRYLMLFDKWNVDGEKWEKSNEDWSKPELDIIEEMLCDGTYDKLHDGGLMKYHEAGKPKKLAIKWHINKSEYSAYFWFDEDGIKTVFDKFYGSHPDTKADFIIRIDAENQKYELALYRYGLKEPQIIPEEVYQLIVFKNKFEDYRSDNYNQESGAWIW